MPLDLMALFNHRWVPNAYLADASPQGAYDFFMPSRLPILDQASICNICGVMLASAYSQRYPFVAIENSIQIPDIVPLRDVVEGSHAYVRNLRRGMGLGILSAQEHLRHMRTTLARERQLGLEHAVTIEETYETYGQHVEDSGYETESDDSVDSSSSMPELCGGRFRYFQN
jgi:hypothetical protein